MVLEFSGQRSMKNCLKLSCLAKIIFFFMVLVLTRSSLLHAQLRAGQYLEESPLGSWNQFGLDSAATLGTGLSQLTLAHNSQILLTNPALLSWLKSSTLTINSGFNQTQLFNYWLVNTGVVSTDSNLTYRGFELNYLGLSVHSGRYTLAAAWAQTENFGRPAIDYRSAENGNIYNRLQLDQSGHLRTFSLALARKFKNRLSLGLSLVFLTGQINRELQEDWPLEGTSMIDSRQQKMTGFYAVFGLEYLINSRLAVGLSLIPPYQRKVKGQNLLSYTSAEVDLTTQGEADDRASQPLVIGAGIKCKLKDNLHLLLESRYFAWDHYYYSYFGENLNRDFKAIVQLGAGLEYQIQAKFLGQHWITPYYVGFKIDPQPMTDISSTYYYLTFGSGFGNESFVLTFSTAIGFEHGSGQNLKNQKIAVTLDLYPGNIFKSQTRR